jgi:aspartyl protease/PDZ domain-containing protein
MLLRRRLLLAVSCGYLAAAGLCLALPNREPGPADGTVVPFEMLPSNHMVVQVKVNGKGPFRLIFDLGAPVTVLSNKAAEAAGVVDEKTPRSFLFSMRGEANIKRLQVGDLTAEDMPAIVFDHPAVKMLGKLLGRPIDGIVGYTFFAHYKTTIDYQARKMVFKPVHFEVRNLMKDLPGRLMGPRTAKHRTLASGGLWGLEISEPANAIDSMGVSIDAVLPGSPAEAAGLRAGDVLAAIDGRWTTSVMDTLAAAATIAPRQKVPVSVIRKDKEITLMVTPTNGL